LAASLLTAAEATGAVLATVGNLYPYGPVDGAMHEGLPDAATFTNGRIRAAMWADALAAHRSGRVRAVEVRASDYAGPGVYSHLSVGATSLLGGRTARVIGSADQPHTWTDTRDTARLLVAAAADASAHGRTWIVPSSPPRTQREALTDLATAAGVPMVRLAPVGRRTLRVLGLVNGPLGVMADTCYQFDRPFVVDDRAARALRSRADRPGPPRSATPSTAYDARSPRPAPRRCRDEHRHRGPDLGRGHRHDRRAAVDRRLARPLRGESLLGYLILGTQFGWPDVLDQPGTTALDAFVEAETAARIGFTVFTASSLVLIPAALGVQQALAPVGPAGRTFAAFGVLAAFAQVLGWIRWPLAVPTLADSWRAAEGDEVARASVAASYDVLNAYGGGALGEHLGWLLQAVWAVGLAVVVLRAEVVPGWFARVGAVATVAWAVTVPVATSARLDALELWGLTAYSVWYVWLLVLGVLLMRRDRRS